MCIEGYGDVCLQVTFFLLFPFENNLFAAIEQGATGRNRDAGISILTQGKTFSLSE